MSARAATHAEPRDISAGRYLASLILAAAIFAGLGSLARIIYLDLPCDHTLYSSDQFIGYCETNAFGVYEHGAFAFNLLPGIGDALRRADVVFLGESDMQTATSADAVDRYFDARAIPFYRFGFGYEETSPFPIAMMRKYQMRPRVVVVNADPFFTTFPSPVGYRALHHDPDTWLHVVILRVFQQIHAPICTLGEFLCRRGKTPRAWFRSKQTGKQTWINGDPDRTILRITEQRGVKADGVDVAAAARLANSFIDEFHLNRACVIFTGVPTPKREAEAIATRLAAATGVPLVLPDVAGLATRDETHLNRPSAERWAAALMAAIDPIVSRCLAAKPTAARG